jgi:hypothetical protein
VLKGLIAAPAVIIADRFMPPPGRLFVPRYRIILPAGSQLPVGQFTPLTGWDVFNAQQQTELLRIIQDAIGTLPPQKPSFETVLGS